MFKLTSAQQIVFDKLTEKPQSAYTLRTSLATLRALVRKGAARDVTPFGAGDMASPRTHYKYARQ